MTRKVGHFNEAYLPPTHTFVYQYLSNHVQYDPFVCAIKSRNPNKFPFQPRYVLLERPRWSPRFWLYAALVESDLQYVRRRYYESVIAEANPDLLHAHFGPQGVDLLPYRSSNRPLITSFYGYDASMIVEQHERIRDAYDRLFADGDLFLVEGPSMRDKLRSLGCSENKIELQRIAIDTDRIEPRYPDFGDEWRILMVGRFVEKKGMPDGIEAFARAFSQDDDAVLRIVGDGPGDFSRGDLKQLAASYGIEEKVTFTGFLDYEEYLAEIRTCDIFLAPSKRAESGDSEGGAPTVLLEAQASGKPIVATTHADIPYVVEENTAGRLATPGDVGELTDALRWCQSHPGRLRRMGEAGRKNMERNHDIDTLVEKLERRYDEVCQR